MFCVIALLLVLIMTIAGVIGFLSGFQLQEIQSWLVLCVLTILGVLATLVFFPACHHASGSLTPGTIATMLLSAAMFTGILLCVEGALIARLLKQ